MYSIDPEARTALSDLEPGPAGILIGDIGHDFVAEVDVATGTVLSISDSALVALPDRLETVRDVVENPDALDAVRRLTMATVYGDDESAMDDIWWKLDRVLARLDLEAAIPHISVHPEDLELASSIATLSDANLEISASRVMRVQALVDALRRKVPELSGLPSTGELIDHAVSDELLRLGPKPFDKLPLSVMVPRLILLSAGPDLAHSLAGKERRLDRVGALDVELVVPINTSVDIEQLACYLIEPDHTQPIAHVSIFTRRLDPDGQDVLAATFRLRPNEVLDGWEFVVLPAFHSPNSIVKASTARSMLEAEVRIRTAVRLAQKSMHPQALECLSDGERALRTARPAVPRYYGERLREIRRRIEGADYESDLLGDL